MATAFKLTDPTPAAEIASEEVLVHVRYAPSTDINAIGFCPEGLSSKEWLARLFDSASQYYQTFANGRGLFRIPGNLFEDILASLPKTAA